jgi:hypothetical protein
MNVQNEMCDVASIALHSMHEGLIVMYDELSIALYSRHEGF